MSHNKYFDKALINFTHEFASGGVIRKYADMGYSVKAITEKMDFKTPSSIVGEIVWKRYLDTRVVLLDEPGQKNGRERYTYVKEYLSGGRPSFRRVKIEEDIPDRIKWECLEMNAASLMACLNENPSEGGQIYVSCDLRWIRLPSSRFYRRHMDVLSEQQKEYLIGLPWPEETVYFLLNDKMRTILHAWARAGLYEGKIYIRREMILA